MPLFRFRRSPAPVRGRRGLLLALLTLEIIVLTGLVGALLVRSDSKDDDFVARETLLAESDLPPGWVPVAAAAYPYMTNSPLLRLMLEEQTVAGAFSVYRDPESSAAVATYVVFRPDAPPILKAGEDDSNLKKVAPLVIEMELLARQRLDGAIPELFLAATDVPTAGALRGRSLAPPEGEGVQSESVLFTTGPVLAVVIVEHPRGDEPFRPVEELAQIVYQRIQELLD